MRFLIKFIKCLIVLCCVILFFAGALWNIVVLPDTEETIVFTPIEEPLTKEEVEEQQKQQLQNRIAALRMERDAAWQQLYHTVEQLTLQNKDDILHQYALLQYQEQKLELLLEAKGISSCVAVLDTEQANIIVPEEQVKKEFEKLFDLVKRNTNYEETQIILIPLREP